MHTGAVDGLKDWDLLDFDINEEIVIEKLQKLRQNKAGGEDELVGLYNRMDEKFSIFI